MIDTDLNTFSCFVNSCINELHNRGKVRTANSYTSAYRHFMIFRKGEDLPLSDLNSQMIMDYNQYLSVNNVKPNTIAYYISALRSIYNKAVSVGLVVNTRPFDDISTKVLQTKITALTEAQLCAVRDINLLSKPELAFARDMFLFSFYTRGMSYYDMASLKTGNIKSGVLTYSKGVTKMEMSIKIEPCVNDIIKRYSAKTVGTDYLLPIIVGAKRGSDDYNSAIRALNIRLKKVAKRLNLDISLTSAVARHSWAAIALQKGISYQTISRCLGYNTEDLSRRYLKLLEQNIMDRANHIVIS